ncbi:MAG: hypothetical protein ACI89L_000086 [Phycisphaerales bacterium]|jgi:hypothetical protein
MQHQPRWGIVRLRTATLVLFALGSGASAQSDPSNFGTVINVPGDSPTLAGPIGSDTQVNLYDGGLLEPRFVAGDKSSNAAQNIELNLYGGTVGAWFCSAPGVTVNVFGEIEYGPDDRRLDSFFRSEVGGTLNMFGGEFLLNRMQPSTELNVYSGVLLLRPYGNYKSLLVDGGTVRMNNFVNAHETRLRDGRLESFLMNGGVLSVEGGVLETGMYVHSGGEIGFSGGSIGGSIRIKSADKWTISGGEFAFNGVPGSATEILNKPYNSSAVLSATLSDGTVTAFTVNSYDSIRFDAGALETVPLAPYSTAPVAYSTGLVPLRGLRAGQSLSVTGTAGLIEYFTGVNASLTVEAEGTYTGLEMVASEITLAGGLYSEFVSLQAGTVADVTGGQLPSRVITSRDSTMNLYGGEFRLNGQPVTEVPDDLDQYTVLTGVLRDGSPFAIYNYISSAPALDAVVLHESGTPLADLTPIVVDSSPGPSRGLRAGQSMTVVDGGAIPDYFTFVDASLTIEGGDIGDRLFGVRSEITIAGGESGAYMHLYEGSTVRLSSGTLNSLQLFGGSLYLEDGIADDVLIWNSSNATIAGARVAKFTGFQINPSDGGRPQVRIESGHIADLSVWNTDVVMESGLILNVRSGIQNTVDWSGGRIVQWNWGGTDEWALTIRGGEFLLNNQPASGSGISLTYDDTLTGTLADGTPFELHEIQSGFDITLQEEPLPPIDLSQIDVTHAIGPMGLRAGQRLRLGDGGILGQGFLTIGATVDVEGGQLRGSCRFVDSELRIHDTSFDAMIDDRVHPDYAVVAPRLELAGDSTLVIYGGELSNQFEGAAARIEMNDGTMLAIHGGRIENTDLQFRGNNSILITGGIITERFIDVGPGSVVTIHGSDFADQNGPISIPPDGQPHEVLVSGWLEGTLSDGSPLRISIGYSPVIRLMHKAYCVADMNADGILDLGDIQSFIALFLTQDLATDMNGDGIVDFGDISAFVAAFLAGC